jgi:hypothetical protein
VCHVAPLISQRLNSQRVCHADDQDGGLRATKHAQAAMWLAPRPHSSMW